MSEEDQRIIAEIDELRKLKEELYKKIRKQNLNAPNPDYPFKLGDSMLIMCPK